MENRNKNVATYSPPPNDPDILWHYIMCGRIQGPFVEPGLCIVRFWFLVTAVLRVCIVHVLSLTMALSPQNKLGSGFMNNEKINSPICVFCFFCFRWPLTLAGMSSVMSPASLSDSSKVARGRLAVAGMVLLMSPASWSDSSEKARG